MAFTAEHKAMKKKNIKTIPMYGPSISDPSKIVNRDVPEDDFNAFLNAGYKRGSKEEAVETEVPAAEVTYTEADAIAQNDGKDVTKGKKGR